MSPETVTLEEAAAAADAAARRSASRPTARRSLAANGRYGPYVKKGKESRSLESEEQLFTITLDEALAMLAAAEAARPRRREAAAARSSAPTRSAASRSSLKEGRFGPYVTDGETNASLRRGDDLESIDVERAAELLADRRARRARRRSASAAADDRSVIRRSASFRAERRPADERICRSSEPSAKSRLPSPE